MRKMELIAPCHFGLEAVLRREITDLGYEISEVEDGRITFLGDEEAVCRANIFLRTAERVLIKVGSFHAETFEELFQGTKALEWEILGGKGCQCKEQAVQPVGYSVYHEKSDGRTFERCIQGQLVSGDRSTVPGTGFSEKR